ncbi:SGNH/GDSL hydrolase family protein [Frondihabitans sp. PAMC 28766]|uniref:SGNH/GDSL hydrolase family protein n=1 Tax=Frondihabitans sp. PAMC 28766 TaxID=1795630 RepID=UPI0012FFB6EC|nr:SGNH/GDSL hydrolase family protein [Frondihabitans sp. PAMC 28766]
MKTALVGLLATAALVALVGCSNAQPSEPRAESTSSTTAPDIKAPTPTGSTAVTDPASALGTASDPVRVAIVGDSLTAGGARIIPQDGLDQDTWMTYAEGDGIKWVGGWAMGGTTTQIEAAHVTPIKDVDVLVLMSGTNNVRLHIPFAQAAKYYEQIVDTIKPKKVIIGAIPPYNHDPEGAAVYERQLEKFVRVKHWNFTDPWGFARDGLVYQAGISNDGIHPTTAGYKIVGREYRDAILQIVSSTEAG